MAGMKKPKEFPNDSLGNDVGSIIQMQFQFHRLV